MDIITYHNFDTEPLIMDDAAVKSMPSLQRKAEKYSVSAADVFVERKALFQDNNETQKNKDKKSARLFFSALLGWLHPVPVLICCMMVIAGSIPIMRDAMGMYSIRTMSFWAEPSFDRALHSYVFPEAEAFSSKQQRNAVVLQSYPSVVTFHEHRIRKGETISGIAMRSGLKNIGTILSVNGISNARRITVGKVLKIPSTDGLLYTVKKNDTLAAIAAKNKIEVTALLDANDLQQSTLTVGQELFIPGAVLSSFNLRKAMGELFVYPIRGRLTSKFGYRADPFTGARSFHSGIDLAAPTGTPVKATLDGKVVEAGVNRIFGNYVIIRHDRGYQSLYGHLHTITAKRGRYVKQGAVIGTVGNTGYSTGPHLHLSIYKYGKLINPFSVLK